MRNFKRINFDDVKPFIVKAKKEQVSFENPPGAEWYGIFKDEKLVSFFCLVVKGKTARFKSNYTVPEYRKQGCLQTFIEFSISECIKRGVCEMSAFCTPLSIKSHIQNGAKIISEKKDVWFIKYIFKRKNK